MTEKTNLDDFIDMKTWFNSEPVTKFWEKHESGWFAILEFRKPTRIELAQVNWYDRHGGGARDCHGAEVMSCVLPWFVDLYNKTLYRHKDCKSQDTESALKSIQDIITGIEEGTLVIPDYRTKS